MRKLIDDTLSSLWFRPALWMILYACLAVGLVRLDGLLERRGLSAAAIPGLIISEPEGARAMLGAIVSAMLTVTSLAFSLMMVSVVQTANAYSPRLLREYIADTHNQHALGVLLGTFCYSLLVLHAASAPGPSPALATNVAVLLSLVATVALVYFLHHVAQSIKVSSIIELIIEQTKHEIERGFPRDIGEPWRDENGEMPEMPESEAKLVYANSSGYVQLFVGEALLAATRDADLIVRMHWAMGDYVLAGTPIASVHGEADEAIVDKIRRACVLGAERTFAQDVSFGLLQLTDVALRALSPGINDPSTAGSAIDALTFLLGKSVKREPASHHRCDEAGQLRIVFRPSSFEDLIGDSYMRILQYGKGDVLVMQRLLTACEQLSVLSKHQAQRDALWSFVETINTQATHTVELPAQRRSLDGVFEQAQAKLGRPPLPKLDREG